jgi:hypothetical protein
MVVKDFQVLITVSSLLNGAEKLAGLMVQDITEFFALKSPFHVCKKCKKVRGGPVQLTSAYDQHCS